MDEQTEAVESDTPYEPPIAEAIEGPDPDSVAPGAPSA
jgi:hypothetical protein